MELQFHEILSDLRHRSNKRQRQVAADLGISQALLSHYENGTREPGLGFLNRACDYYGVTADYLLGRSQAKDMVSRADITALAEGLRVLADKAAEMTDSGGRS